MIVVTVELWPHGDRTKREIIASGEIINDGTGTNGKGNYNCAFSWKAWEEGRPSMLKRSKVKGFERLWNNCWSLIREALNAEVEEEK